MFQKGPGEGYGAWGKEEVLKRVPEAKCIRIHMENHRTFYKVGVFKKGWSLEHNCPASEEHVFGTAYSARDAWCAAAGHLMNQEHQKEAHHAP